MNTPPPPPDAGLVSVARLPRGARGCVAAVEGAEETVERLAAVGVVPGTAFRVVRSGSPTALAIGETRLGLGQEWTDSLRVIPL